MRLQANPFFIILFILFAGSNVFSQSVTTPQLSPKAEVSQTIGISKITVNYSRPSVKGRKIWGELVPYGWNVQATGYGNPAPWRAGANENTTITFSHDAKVEGIKIPTGTYGLFIAVSQDNSSELIISKNSKSWGSFFYNPAEDQMRAKIQERDITFIELLTYDFINVTKNNAELVLNWEKKQFLIKIEFAVNEIVMANAKEELRGQPGFSADAYITAAFYSFQNNIETEQAMKWIDQALELEPTNFEALYVKSRLLVRKGKAEEAEQIMADALGKCSESEITSYGNQLVGLGIKDRAIKVFTTGTVRFPNSATIWDSLGETYFMKGDKDNAIKCFKKSLSLNPAPNVKTNSEKYLKQLGAL